MKKILLGAAALSLFAAPAMAQDGASVNLGGTVAELCTVSGGGANISLNPYLGVNSDGFLANIAPNQFTEVADLGAAFGNVMCNTPGTITLSGDLLSADGRTSTANNFAGPGFTHKIAVRATGMNFGGVTLGDINTGNDQFSRSVTSSSWFAGAITGSLQIFNDASRRPIAGDYEATWTLTVAPAA